MLQVKRKIWNRFSSISFGDSGGHGDYGSRGARTLGFGIKGERLLLDYFELCERQKRQTAFAHSIRIFAHNHIK